MGWDLLPIIPANISEGTGLLTKRHKKLGYWLFEAVKSIGSHAEKFKEMHVCYITRAKSIVEDAITNCNCLQNPSNYLHDT